MLQRKAIKAQEISCLSETNSQVREKGSAEAVGEVTRRFYCCGPVDELPRREVRRDLLG